MPEAAPSVLAGLVSIDKAPVPLTGVAIDAQINNLSARVTVAQRFVNREQKPIEAVYLFPLDEGASVCAFEAIVDGTLVVGEVKEREEAFRAYDEAMEEGHGAFLLDEERPDVFQASVGNLLPGKEVLLKLTYVAELNVDGANVRFVVPTTVSPRYAPAADRTAVGRPDSETLNPPRAWDVPYGLDLTVRLSMGGAIRRIESPSHAVSVELGGDNATVTLSQRDTALDRDFVLLVEAPSLNTPRTWVERDDDGSHAVAVALTPSLPSVTTPAEVIFVVDRSGSMGGTSIEEVRNALQLCLRSMVAGCRFNIIGFGSSTQQLFRENRAYDDASLREASEHVSSLQADLGGTELLPALELAFNQPRQASLARQIVVLTDGGISNTDAAIALCRTHAPRARVFTFGIGAGASHHLVRGLARAGGGAAEFIYPGERIEPKVVGLFGRLLSPALTNVRVDWGGLDVKQAPSTGPVLFNGGRLLLYGFVRTAPCEWTKTVRIFADSPDGQVTFESAIDPSRIASGRTVATLAARARIRELEESPEWTTTRGSRQRERKAPGVTSEIIALSLRYGLLSRETSYVAIERRDTPVTGDVHLRRVPIAVTSGWGGLHAGTRALSAMYAGLSPADGASPPASQALHASAPWFRLRRPVERGAGPLPSLFGLRALLKADSPAASRGTAKSNAVVTLVTLQHADGSWDLDAQLAAAIGRDLHEIEAAIGPDTTPAAARAWATALAVIWLRRNAAGVEDEWRLIAAKADQWLSATGGRRPDGSSWYDAAEKFMTR
jgi:hypothetical protein